MKSGVHRRKMELSPGNFHLVGCYWTESCQNKWIGGCGGGHVIIDQSDDCNGLCSESKYPPCLPLYTHFHCCKPDCSDPYLTDKDAKLGYCKTGVELAVQVKPKEVFRWVPGPWMKCSSPCGGGIRYRDVGCYGSIEDPSIPPYPVDDIKCLDEEMPTSQEPCNLRSCEDFSDGSPNRSKHNRTSGWLIMLVVLLGVGAVGGLGFAGYTFYRRRSSTHSGFVYIMLDGYS